jgi:hypothetical protein
LSLLTFASGWISFDNVFLFDLKSPLHSHCLDWDPSITVFLYPARARAWSR